MATHIDAVSEDKGIIHMGDKVVDGTVVTRSCKVTQIEGDLFEAVHEEDDVVVATVRGTYKDLSVQGEKFVAFK